MTDSTLPDLKRLMDAATPLPWRGSRRSYDFKTSIEGGRRVLGAIDNQHDAALIVEAVNRLPLYEEATEILAAFMELPSYHADWCFIHTPTLTTCECGIQQGRIAARSILSKLGRGIEESPR